MDDALKNYLTSPIRESEKFYIKGYNDTFIALGRRGNIMISCTKAKPDLRLKININNPDIYKKEEDFEGVDPFLSNNIRFTNFGLDSIFSYIGFDRRTQTTKDGEDMPYVNFNPYFIINGEKVHYQRGFVWTLEQKQNLIDSVYRGLEIGRCIVHKHSWEEQEKRVKEGFKDFASRDIVDGKQRLSTLIEFVEGKFPDKNGFYYKDLSPNAQRKFGQFQGLLYGEMDEKSTIDQICDAFLNNATAGTPISLEHINFMIDVKAKILTNENT